MTCSGTRMIADHVYIFFTFFGPDLVEKEKDKKVNFWPALQPFLFTVDISHMRGVNIVQDTINFQNICRSVRELWITAR